MKSASMGRSVRRVLTAQAAGTLLLLALVVLATALLQGADAAASLGLARAKAAAFGALLGIATTVVTARSVLHSSHAAAQHPHFGLLPIYAGLLLKLLLVAGGTFAGLVHLNLEPLYVVLGYITMQAGYFWAGTNPDE